MICAVVAHPDDESLIAGGTLALAADAGLPTGAVSLTRGGLGPIADPALADRATLPAVREHELADAAAALGVGLAACLDQPDGELAWTDHVAVAEELVALLEPYAPTVLLTFGDDGVYWHPDHIAAALVVRLTAARLPRRPLVLEVVWPPATVPALVAAAADRGLAHDLWGLAPEAFGSEGPPATLSIDVRPVIDRKLAALRAHRTQLGPGHLLTALPDDLAREHLGHEHWRLVRG